jgi:hypothetical protein
MRRRILTELASNPDLISGIYNYCDRWCERCPLTSHCLVYATEQEDDNNSPESHDIQNQAFWSRLSNIFQETREMITEWAAEAGVDLNQIVDEEDEKQRKRKRQQVESHSLTRAGKKYANDASDWFRDFDQLVEFSDVRPTDIEVEQSDQVEDAREVIQWYQYQIAVKTMRALSGVIDDYELECQLAADGFPRDSDGSAKVALIGTDRSIAAWRLMQLAVPDRSESIVYLILQLERLRQRIEKRFPNARAFIRPGFDEELGEAN